MSAALLAVLVTLATIPPVHALVWTTIRLWQLRAPRSRRAGEDADALFLTSIAPGAAALGTAVLVTLPAFLIFEPPDRREWPGALMAVSAALGAGYLGAAAARVIGFLRLSRRCTITLLSGSRSLPPAEWGLPAYAIDARYPVVAVAGVLRPRLLIDRSVLDSCSAEELQAIAAHERAHVVARDNARRLIISACVGSESESAQHWRAAAEIAADARAATDPDRAAVLAGALIKIARLAAVRPPQPIPFAAIHDGAALEMRVRRLLSTDAPPAPRDRRGLVMTTLAVAMAVMAAQGQVLLAGVHSFIELLVRSH